MDFRKMQKNIYCCKKLVLLTLFFTVLTVFLSATAYAGFTDSGWKWYDHDGSHDTSKNIYNNSAMSISAAGMDVWTNVDEYASYYLNDISGDFEATVEITYQENTNNWAKAGIMVRDRIDKSGQNHNGIGYCILAVTPENGVAFQYDSDDNGMLDSNVNIGRTTVLPYWLKMRKEGNTYTGYYSTDGSTWTEVSSQTFGSTKTIQDVGIFVSSHADNNICKVVFHDFNINNHPVPTSYTITASAGENGSISPSGNLTVSTGNSETFTIVPDPGYQVDPDSVTVDGSPAVLTNNEYTFSNVSDNHTISANFSAITYTITASAGDNGSISPSGDSTIPYDGTLTYSVTPNNGYVVDSVTVDGNAAELTNDQYTFLNVTGNHEIHVTFKTAPTPPGGDSDTIAGCSTNTIEDYSSGFDAGKFDLNNMTVQDGAIVLSTGADAINPNDIVIPFDQEISVSFLYEGAGYTSDFGWMLKSDAVDSNGNFKGWNNIPLSARHPIFVKINDDTEGWGGDGILNTDYGNGNFPTTNETSLAAYNDGTEYKFTVDGDGHVTPKDMKKTLGTFAAGTEIVFFLTADKRWTYTEQPPNGWDPNVVYPVTGVFFTKKDWNPDTYAARKTDGTECRPAGVNSFTKYYNLNQASLENGCTLNGGWLAATAISRLDADFGVTLSGTYGLPVTWNKKYSHVIVGAPDNDPDQWILGWEDLMGAGDSDHNDMVFKINRKTGGVAELKSTEAIVPADSNSYYTAVTFEVWDSMPCSGSAEINYYVSIDNGTNWVEITDWDKVNTSDASKAIGAEITDWTPGTPQYTYRSRRIDFAGRDLYGRAIIWKAVMSSYDPACTPKILNVGIEGEVSTNGTFSRGEPVVAANVLYSGSYETPALSWSEKVQRGHLKATRLYLPEDPTSTNESLIWDAGSKIPSPDSRNIYFPNTTTTTVTNETLSTGDGTTTTFSGTLSHYPVSATTIIITDTNEVFTDHHTDELKGSLGGTGTINRFTGAYSITFKNAPGQDSPVKASYSYYTTSRTLLSFNTTNISSSMLALDNKYLIGSGFTYDFNDDGKYNGVDKNGTGTADDSDGDWLVQWIRGYSDGSSASTPKAWLLGPIDHSVPAIATPPGKPAWYYGSDIPDSEKTSYDTFRTVNSVRQTVAYVGSRDGMLHAFDAGKFRWGDNPDTVGIHENRGYYLWEGGIPQYGSGAELWAFIPANLIPRLKNNKLSGEDRAFVDASPALADVYVDVNDGNGTKWRTVLLCAEGNGGDTVFALDVTDPSHPFFLWEFSDPDLFRSRSSPAVAQIGRILVNGTAKWVAFFVSGKSYDNTLYPSIYMIDVSNGSVLKRIFLDAETAGIGGVPSGQPAIIDSDGNGYIDRIYVGTDKGFMYKVNIPDDPKELNYSITNCVINTDFTDDTGNTVSETQRYHPIYASPTVIVERGHTSEGEITSSVKIFFGTGDSPYYDENINTTDTTYYFFAYTDETKKGNNDPDAVKLDWFYPLPSGHRVFASAFAAAGTIYFGTSTAETEDPCSGSNNGKLIALSIVDGSLIHEVDTGNIMSSPIVDDKHVYVKTPGGLKSYGDSSYNNAVNIEGETNIATKMWREVF